MITHLGCWENPRKACKSRAEGERFRSLSSVLPTSHVGYHVSSSHRKYGLLLKRSIDYNNTFFWLDLAWVAVISVFFRPSEAKAKRCMRQKGARLLHRLGLSVQLLCTLSLFKQETIGIIFNWDISTTHPLPLLPNSLSPKI